MIRRLSFLVVLSAASVHARADAPVTPRIALVVANGSYPGDERLRTALADGEKVAAALAQLGLSVTLKKDLVRKDLEAEILAFAELAKDAETAIFFYSGHAIQQNGLNYLVPIGANITDVESIALAGVTFEKVLVLPGDSVRKLVFLDACRAYPFPGVNEIGWVSGLAAPAHMPLNSFVAFSTEPGHLAADGGRENSPYVKALLKNIGKVGMPLSDLMNRVRIYVNVESDQTPSEFSSLAHEFYFRPPVSMEVAFEGADDDAVLKVNSEVVATAGALAGRGKSVNLASGDNPVEIFVYNQRSFTGGIEYFGGHQPEGWNYRATIKDGNGAVLARFGSGEQLPSKDGPRHGKLFSAGKLVVHVDEETGAVTTRDLDAEAWKH